MVLGQPYIHFKVNNEPIDAVIDYNYTWATVVEAQKGPINTPIYINSAAQAYAIFGIDMRPYFAQTPRSLIMVRAAASSSTNTPQKGTFSFNLESDIVAYKALQEEITLANTEAYLSDDDTWKYHDVDYTFKLFYAYDMNTKRYIPVIEHRDENGLLIPDSYIDAWHNDGRIVTSAEATANESKPDKPAKVETTTTPAPSANTRYPFKEKYATHASNVYDRNQVAEFLTPTRHVIPVIDSETGKTTSLFEVASKYEGVYNISISCRPALKGEGYRIVIKDKDTDVILLLISNGTNVQKIVERINDANLDIEAKITDAGEAITTAMHSYPTSVKTTNIDGYAPLITSSISKGDFILLANKNDQLTYLRTDEADTVQSVPYAINLATVGEQSLTGGNKGEWDESAQRISAKYQAEAHAKALKTLRKIRLAGVFCMYGENAIQYQYLKHGIDEDEPEKGMNNNETCKWRTILLGANAENRDAVSSLISKAKNINNQYVLFLGQGLIDTGMNGYASTLTSAERQSAFGEGFDEEHYLLPYECTQYIAGLRSKLNYGESIFGGQGRKRIRSIGDLKIAPIVSSESEYIWDPNTYIRLNESGVLTFTEDYGHISLTDGVTTVQSGKEEDEEGVMNILKYAENAIYDVCLPYIGRNIDADIENSITTAIEKVLEEMKSTDQTLIDTDAYPAYDVTVGLNSRRNQLLGRIFVYATICPVHAVRQIEVEMTVQ